MMMTSEELAQAVVEWARATCPDLVGGYAYLPEQTNEPLPDVVVEVASSLTQVDAPQFPMSFLQNTWLRTRSVDLSFMVDNSDPEAAVALLSTIEAQTTASLLADGTLGGRVPFVSPYIAYDFTHPFVEREDGTKGREATLHLLVGEPMEVNP